MEAFQRWLAEFQESWAIIRLCNNLGNFWKLIEIFVFKNENFYNKVELNTEKDPTKSQNGPIRPARRGGNQSPGTFRGTRMTYAELITEAIKSSPDLRLTLQQIYVWMMK